jgi:hypothetical protein
MGQQTKTNEDCLRGFITECHLAQAEEEFPGITRLYARCSPRPRTFLDLVGKYLGVSTVPTIETPAVNS